VASPLSARNDCWCGHLEPELGDCHQDLGLPTEEATAHCISPGRRRLDAPTMGSKSTAALAVELFVEAVPTAVEVNTVAYPCHELAKR